MGGGATCPCKTCTTARIQSARRRRSMEIWNDSAVLDWEQTQSALAKLGWSDGLPVVPPTRERVEAALQGSRVEADQIVAVLPPAYESVTWRDVAINAVLAGCKPEYLRVIGAAV